MHPEPELVAMPADRFAAWSEEAAAQLAALRRDSGLRSPEQAAEQGRGIVASRLGGGLASPNQHVLLIRSGERELGTAWLEVAGDQGLLYTLQLEADVDPASVAPVIEATARALGAAKLSVDVFVHDEVLGAFVAGRGYEPSSIQMLLRPLLARDGEPGIRLDPMTEAEYEAYLEPSVVEFADDLFATGTMTRAEADAESRRQFEDELPEGLSTPGHALFTARAGSDAVGVFWLGFDQLLDTGRAFVYDIVVFEEHRRQGYGRAIMLAAEAEARRRGATAIGLHVFGVNHGAIALYESLGYRALETLHVKTLTA